MCSPYWLPFPYAHIYWHKCNSHAEKSTCYRICLHIATLGYSVVHGLKLPSCIYWARRHIALMQCFANDADFVGFQKQTRHVYFLNIIFMTIAPSVLRRIRHDPHHHQDHLCRHCFTLRISLWILFKNLKLFRWIGHVSVKKNMWFVIPNLAGIICLSGVSLFRFY